ncbi:MAG: endonuclease III domain-containing protein [Candidatus Altiarchaeota archaeon]
MEGAGSRLVLIYGRLFDRFGPQGWWPAESEFEMCVGAILTQSTSWANVEKAVARLKEEGLLSVKAMGGCDGRRLSRLIRPTLYHNVKAGKLKSFAGHILEEHGGSLSSMLAQPAGKLRAELLGIWGIGPETADSIILYAARKPSFVVDAYTRRVFERVGFLGGGESYDAVKSFFEDNLARSVRLYDEYHALIVRLAKECCRKRPICGGCPIGSMCAFMGSCV